MNDVELRALKLLRLVWSVLMEQTPADQVVQELNRLHRLHPDLFDEVVQQLERDSGRWSKLSELPQVSVNRGEKGLIESIVFVADQKPSSKEDDTNQLVWVSDHAQGKWLENFAEEILGQSGKKQNLKTMDEADS